VSYERLSPRQKQAVDLLFSGACCMKPYKNRDEAMGYRMGVTEGTAKGFVNQAAIKYSIDAFDWDIGVRLCYLRAKELGML
jgi:hypothetical protein